MSDDFIPLNQSTPQRRSHHGGNQNHRGHQNNRFHGKKHRGGQNSGWMNNSRNSSFASDSNSSFSQSQEGNSIDAYLHPSMLEDPWEKLRRQQNR